MRRLRAEWERQKAVMLAFPHEGTDWAKRGELHKAYAPFVRMAQAIAYSQAVYILCRQKEEIEELFCSRRNITFIELEYNDTWIRDYGVLSLEEDGEALLMDFRFDGWGGKYEAEADNRVNSILHGRGYFATATMQSVDFVLEGGSIESDGRGTILTTSSCLCNPNRNGGLSKEEVEERLSRYIGAKRILWLDHAYLEGDDTDGHIDMLARFVDEETIAYVSCEDRDDPHYEELSSMEAQLRSMRREDGEAYRLIPLPMCEAVYDEEGRRLPASYANFLICNEALLYPSYGVPSDKEADALFRRIFPAREIIPIPCRKLIEEGGSLHCSSMQLWY